MLRKRTIAVMAGATVVMALIPWRAEADQQILDDLIVQGSICAGFDCVNGESFGFDTLRLKENNLRIRAFDTSTSASFPTRDWQITFNDSSNGGANKYSIDDIDGGRIPFTIEAGAPTNSLFVDDGGRLGIRTGTPVVDLHVKTGNTPTLRLEQDGTSGFTPQTWDVAGNESNFFIRDVTNGSKLSFRIRPSAPTSSIDVAANGNVGFGTGAPASAIDITRAGNVQIGLNNTTASKADWRITNNNNTENFRITVDGSGVQEFDLTKSGNLTLTGSIKLGSSTAAAQTGGAGTVYFDGNTLCFHDGGGFKAIVTNPVSDTTCS